MRRRLLIVDDEPAILFALSSYLERREYEIDTAETLEEAASLLAANDYDVVMTDLRLSSRDGKAEEGLEVLRVVRKTRPRARTILLTAYGSPQIEAEATALGLDVYLEKPLPLAELDRLVQAMLHPAATA
jgi:DNA-binding response OmpR family regulator